MKVGWLSIQVGMSGVEVFPVPAGQSELRPTLEHSLRNCDSERRLVTALYTLSGRKAWALGGAGADREKRRSYIQCSMMGMVSRRFHAA